MPSFRYPVEGALSMFDRGMKVFPLKPNSKVPVYNDWQKWAETATYKKIKETGIANPLFNWGVYCGASDITAIDLDVKKVNGYENFKVLVKESDQKHIQTFTVITPTGGYHVYYRGATRSTIGTLAPGIDTRGKGGYVVCPGSVIEGREYRIKDGVLEMFDLPIWLRRKIEDSTKQIMAPLQDNQPIIEGERNKTFISLAGTMRARGMDYNAILAALIETNKRTSPPLTDREIENIARTAANYAPNVAKSAAVFTNMEETETVILSTVDFKSLPKRDWIMKHRFIGGFISLVIAPGGVGKSTLTYLDAISVATGKNYSGFDVMRKGGVWLFNAEDPMTELKRRGAAFCDHYKIPQETLDNIHLSSGDTSPFIIAVPSKDGPVLVQETIEFAVNYIRDNAIVLLIVDPFIGTHKCNENDNMEIETVVSGFRQIAKRTGCAVCLVHHTSKAGAANAANGNDGDMNAARGASALINAVRVAHTFSTMNEKDAKKFNIPEAQRRWYIRLDNAKANLQPPAEAADWFKRENVVLDNTDNVGVIEPIALKTMNEERVKEAERGEKQDLIHWFDSVLTYKKGKDRMTIQDVINTLIYDDDFKGMFDISGAQRKREKLIMLINTGMKIRDKEFIYQYDAVGNKKHWVVCRQITPSEKKENPEKQADPTFPDIDVSYL